MERKSSSSTAVVTSREVKASLRSRSTKLTTLEEQSLRMRHGLGAEDASAPLPRAAAGNEDLADQLLMLEMNLVRAARAAGKAPGKLAAAPKLDNAKSRIVEALEAKKR